MELLEDLDRVKREGERFRQELENGKSELSRIVRELKTAREK
jgi:hypothetical protein